ncbi:MAG: DNA repair protein RadA [Bacteroidales bacterium]|nr:DNA repair protein RadA [Bacteroidales bacterium]
MAKAKTVWFCSSCGNEYPQFLGRCPACGEWNTMKEMEVEPAGKAGGSRGVRGAGTASVASGSERKPLKLREIDYSKEDRVSLGMAEVDRLLGGGIVPGSLVLIGGEPGIGKSTLSLQIPLANPALRTLYVTGEESAKQVKMRAERLSAAASANGAPGSDSPDANVDIFCETLIEDIIAEAGRSKPDLMIVDSVQTMYSAGIDSTPGSVSQIKEVAAMLLRFAKESGVPVILIGHITKDGYIAGPKILEHIVDAVLQFEGENRGSYRVLRSIKNRFGSTSEIAVFEMTGSGLREVKNPSELLIPLHEEGLSGTAICATLDGTRPMLFEVQALVSSAVYGTAQRSATGFDTRRLNMLLAVLEKRAGFHLAAKDVFLNMAGGLKVSDPAADLAVVCAVLSSNFDFAIPADVCFAGEVGLSGEIRPVSQCGRRIAEAARLGFKKVFVSAYEKVEEAGAEAAGKAAGKAGSPGSAGIKIVRVGDVPELVKKLFK